MEIAAIPGLSIAYLNDSKIMGVKSFGVKNSLNSTPVFDDTLFEVASLTKPVFVYCVLKLVDSGVLGLDTSLMEYYPPDLLEKNVIGHPLNQEGFETEWFCKINARMILSHTSELPHDNLNRLLKLEFEPGSRWLYSSYGYEYLQKVVEYLRGEPLEETVNSLVLQPLGMKDSGMKWREEYSTRAAVGHNLTGYTDGKFIKQWTAISSVSLYTTARDYACFLENLLCDDLLDVMMTPQIEVNEYISWGLGLGLEHTKLGDAFWHWGDTGTFRSFFKGYRDCGSGVVYLTNSFNGLSIADEITTTLFGDHENRGLFWLNYAQYRYPRMRLLRVYANGDTVGGERLLNELAPKYPFEFTAGNLNSIGYALIHADRINEAIALYEMAIKHYPYTKNLQIGLSDAHLASGEYELAKNILIETIKIEYDDITAVWHLKMLKVLIKILNEEPINAARLLNDLMEKAPQIYSVKSLCNYGAKLYQMNRIEDAIKFLEFCSNIYNESPVAYLQTGTIYMKEDIHEKAIRHFQKAVEIDKNCWQANQLLEQMIFNKILVKGKG